ncbi:hypothetical protein X736_22090 [Mesorhizobium sp. L2C089B000]|nr:hypothetical protein X736_22090 [Mesorhizobium sp. L2C089B000]
MWRWAASTVVVGSIALVAPAGGQSMHEAEAENLQRAIAFLEKNGGLQARNGMRLAIPVDLINRLLSSLTPVSFKLKNNIGTVEMLTAKAQFSIGFPKLSLSGRATLLGGSVTVPAAIDAVARFAFDRDANLRLSVDVLSVRPDLGALPASAANLVEALATAEVQAAAKAVSLTIPLGKLVNIPLPAQSGTIDFKVGDAAVTLGVQSKPFTRAVRAQLNEIITLPDGVYLYGQAN